MITPPNLNILNNNPSTKDVLDLLRKDIFLNLNCHAIGTVETFYPDKQTADVTINYTKTFYKQSIKEDQLFAEPYYINYPLLVNCPVVVMGGGKAFLTMPIEKGDQCMLMFNDRAIDNWFTTGQKSNISINRFHSIADAIALIGLHSLQNPIPNYDSTRAVLRYDTTKVSVGAKVGIQNAGGNLNTILQQLITHLEGLIAQVALITVSGVTTGGGFSGTPANAAAITAISAQLNSDATALGALLE